MCVCVCDSAVGLLHTSVRLSVLVLRLDWRDHFVCSVRCCSDDAHDLCEESPKRAPCRISDRIDCAHVCEYEWWVESVFEHCIMMWKAPLHWAALQMELVPKCLSSSTIYFGIVSFNIQNNTHKYLPICFSSPYFYPALGVVCRFYSRPPRIILHMHFQQFKMLLVEIRTTAYAHTIDQNELLYNPSSLRVSSPFLWRRVHALHSYIYISMANVCCMRSCKLWIVSRKWSDLCGEWVSEESRHMKNCCEIALSRREYIYIYINYGAPSVVHLDSSIVLSWWQTMSRNDQR